MSTTFREAFCLMRYACDCGHRELIWNSRDGVTPFGMTCPSCGTNNLRHIEFNRDVFAPDHKPHHGQGIWRDGTPDEAEAIMRRRLASCIGTPYECDADRTAEIIAECRDENGEHEFRRGWPMFARYAPAVTP